MHRVLFNAAVSAISSRLATHLMVSDVVSDSSTASSDSFHTPQPFSSTSAVDLLLTPLLTALPMTPLVVGEHTHSRILSSHEKACAAFILSLAANTPRYETAKTLVLALVYRATHICPFCGSVHTIPSTCVCGLPCSLVEGKPTILCARTVSVPHDFHEVLAKVDKYLALVLTYLVKYPTFTVSPTLFLSSEGNVPFFPSGYYLPADLAPTVLLHFLSFATTFTFEPFVTKYTWRSYFKLRFQRFLGTHPSTVAPTSHFSVGFAYKVFVTLVLTFFLFSILTILRSFTLPFVAAQSATQTFVVVSYLSLFMCFCLSSCVIVTVFVAPRARVAYTQIDNRSWYLLAAFLVANFFYAVLTFVVVRPFMVLLILLVLSPVPTSAFPLFPLEGDAYTLPSAFSVSPFFAIMRYLVLFAFLIAVVLSCTEMAYFRLRRDMYFYYFLLLLSFFVFFPPSQTTFLILLLIVCHVLSLTFGLFLPPLVRYFGLCAIFYSTSVESAPVTSFSVNLVVSSVSFDLRDEEVSPVVMASFFLLSVILAVIQFLGYATLISALRR